MTVIRHRYEPTDPRLGRHVEHDERSRDYTIPEPAGVAHLVSIKHPRYVPVFDQGKIGSCTANAAIGCLGTGPFYEAIGKKLLSGSSLADESFALACYSDEQQLLGYGPFPPNDHGGSGLAIAKVLKRRGFIPSYHHALSLHATLAALAKQPVIIGIPWLSGMSTPDLTGKLTVAGTVRGGHEIVLDELDVENQRVWLTNSWSTSWGVNGRAWLAWTDLEQLLADRGDCTVFTVPGA
ncbi:hypothetical protein Back2_18030 [Nocardioides baekrokdamisoli]|uniref:Peptidase C1A papain C-terminal domain-containing protein n=1 Tax=Nocardioides baekrokdamisoli TaxID=1804624 RepID=A0A3G9IGQ1_9ACTN|nr:hypothetical protein [Nocardioides baekrokdamisoli]BBH17516.1 hypothetical protein Back2_18030 [Nocardioides baekrokdamisoli]